MAVIEARTSALSAAFLAAGVKDADRIPDEARATFDAWLISGPEPEDPITRLRREMGV